MHEKQRQSLADLAADLVNPDRQFAPRTPHSYAHTAGATVLRRINLVPDHSPGEALGSNVRSLFPDLPEATVYFFPTRESGQ